MNNLNFFLKFGGNNLTEEKSLLILVLLLNFLYEEKLSLYLVFFLSKISCKLV